jgi:hypothetical protein
VRDSNPTTHRLGRSPSGIAANWLHSSRRSWSRRFFATHPGLPGGRDANPAHLDRSPSQQRLNQTQNAILVPRTPRPSPHGDWGGSTFFGGDHDMIRRSK